MTLAVLGLGSNQGDREAHLRPAIERLRTVLSNVTLSDIYESKAVLLPGAPEDWDIPYLNMAIAGETDLTPGELLRFCKIQEKELGRIERGIWAPREIDIDILAYADEVVELPELTIPHMHLLTRDFALLPLSEIAPNWRYPLPGQYYYKTAEALVVELGIATHRDFTFYASSDR